MKSSPLIALSITLLLSVACNKVPHPAESEPTKEPAEAAKSDAPAEAEAPSKTTSLFNGDDLGEWTSVDFDGTEGEVHVSFDGDLTFEHGDPMTAVVWTGDAEALPKSNYEISLEALRHFGDDFICGLTFPVKDSHATLIVGGWGGVVVGISSIDDENAALNETSELMEFERNQWYKIRLRVTDDHLQAWIDDKEIFKVMITGRKISLLPGMIEKCAPLGIANFRCRTAYRNIELRRLE